MADKKVKSLNSLETLLKIYILFMFLVLMGCASVRLPELKDSHPASPKAAEAPHPKQFEMFKIEKRRSGSNLE